MGVQRLIKKTEMNYRKGYTHSECSQCNHFVCKFVGGIPGPDSRCRIIGLDTGRMFRVSPHSICDAYDNSIHIERYLGKAGIDLVENERTNRIEKRQRV